MTAAAVAPLLFHVYQYLSLLSRIIQHEATREKKVGIHVHELSKIQIWIFYM